MHVAPNSIAQPQPQPQPQPLPQPPAPDIVVNSVAGGGSNSLISTTASRSKGCTQCGPPRASSRSITQHSLPQCGQYSMCASPMLAVAADNALVMGSIAPTATNYAVCSFPRGNKHEFRLDAGDQTEVPITMQKWHAAKLYHFDRAGGCAGRNRGGRLCCHKRAQAHGQAEDRATVCGPAFLRCPVETAIRILDQPRVPSRGNSKSLYL